VTADELEQAALSGWIADSEPLGGWTLRSANGFSGRANSCLAVGDPGVGYQRAAQVIIDYFTERDLEPRAQVIAGSPAEQALNDLGWQQTYVVTTVMAQPLAGLLGDHPRNPLVEISSELTDQWWQAFLQYRPVADHRVSDDESARRILAGVPPVGLAAIRSSAGKIAAVGRGHVSGEWLGLAALWTDPDHRRNGMATMIITELGHWAARYGARNVYLQVAKQNTGAIAAYARLGFAPHHDYVYLRPAVG
jgi:ribosomal protein S18 acetylase RimI-like enzyme